MRERIVWLRTRTAARRWRFRLALWAAFAALAMLHPWSPQEGRGYLVGLIVLALFAGLAAPRPLISVGVGLWIATLLRMSSMDPGLDPYISVELVTVPIFVLPTRFLVWFVVDRHNRQLVDEALAAGLG